MSAKPLRVRFTSNTICSRFKRKSIREDAKKFYPTNESTDAEFEPIKIEGVLADEAGRPTNDGTAGSALYAIPFKLSRAPTHEWSELFIRTWDHPPQFSTRHRPGIGRVERDRIILTRTTIEEVRDVHRATLKLVVDAVNSEIAERVRRRRAAQSAEEQQEQERRANLRRIADDLSFN